MHGVISCLTPRKMIWWVGSISFLLSLYFVQKSVQEGSFLFWYP